MFRLPTWPFGRRAPKQPHPPTDYDRAAPPVDMRTRRLAAEALARADRGLEPREARHD